MDLQNWAFNIQSSRGIFSLEASLELCSTVLISSMDAKREYNKLPVPLAATLYAPSQMLSLIKATIEATLLSGLDSLVSCNFTFYLRESDPVQSSLSNWTLMLTRLLQVPHSNANSF